jgi:hypothetical protein
MTMGTISDIIGLFFFLGVAIMVYRSNRSSRRERNRIDTKMYED